MDTNMLRKSIFINGTMQEAIYRTNRLKKREIIMKKQVIGILAHVDAGKTTLAESMLYLTGAIRKLGRVDHKDAFLDTYELERARGITIFSKQAVFTCRDMEVTLLDTPGHVDFSAEMERTLQVLDYAILVISGSDGVQGHTQTLWRLLARYHIPTFLFINKMDLEVCDHAALLQELKRLLNDGCIDFSEGQEAAEFMENLAVHDEVLLEHYLENGNIETEHIAGLIAQRKVFPCYFGSALKLMGVEEFLEGLAEYTIKKQYPSQFGAKIYKITRDEQGNRLTHMKITGGSLRVKMQLTGYGHKEGETASWEDKVDQIRIYSGNRYETRDLAEAGAVCAVMGLGSTYPGEGLGSEAVSDMPVLEPVLTYQIILPADCNAHDMFIKLKQLEEEDPQLHIVWLEQLKEIHIRMMGEIQVEILKSLIFERFGVNVEFGQGNILYKETIVEPVEGVGHFEPLRHYAEVHLKLEPEEPGSGLSFDTDCSEDILDRNWQRLIITHLEEKEHPGVLTGSPITDMRITLIAGRAHQKHTQGGDFRQATYRAVRQGLKKARSILLEPYYDYRLELPAEAIGRAMSDMKRMSGTFSPPDITGEMVCITGRAPVATMRGYQAEVTAYTRGKGRLFCQPAGYLPCHNAEEAIETIGYDSERDMENPTGSVFCSHGAGFIVGWDEVENYMHVESGWVRPEKAAASTETDGFPERVRQSERDQLREADKSRGTNTVNEDVKPIVTVGASSSAKPKAYYEHAIKADKELEDIFARTYGPIKKKLAYSPGGLGYEKKENGKNTTKESPEDQGEVSKERITEAKTKSSQEEPQKEYLLVDGYNIIFSWEKLNALAQKNMDAARYKLMDILCNYQGFLKCIVILVFDAYKVKGGTGSVQEYHNIHVVYTKEAETADQYIEKVTHQIARKHRVTVATSDALEQLIILGQGAIRISANDLLLEITRVRDQIRRDYLDRQMSGRSYLGEKLGDHLNQTDSEQLF